MDDAQGLKSDEAARRLAKHGPNELPADEPRSMLHLAFEVVREPMIGLLLAAGAIYLALGSVGEAIVLGVGILLIIAIELYQEWRAERALDALRELSSPRALVLRDGEPIRIAGRDVVVGDVALLAEGDRVPADGVLLEAEHLSVDESLLTGEALGVDKRADPTARAPQPPGGDGTPFVYSGTLVTRGRGRMLVLATGRASAIGRIGVTLAAVETEDTPLRRETRRVVRIAATLGVAVCLLVAVLYASLVGSWLQGLLAGVALAISMTPEEFPVVLTVFLALGAWRLSRRNVLTRRSLAIEALGSATVLCADKTGTITRNRMAVAQLDVEGERLPVTTEGPLVIAERFHDLAESLRLASQRDPVDPMERALDEFTARALAGTEHVHDDWARVREYPLAAEMLALCEVWRAPDERRAVIAAKGAPEAIADLCHFDPMAGERLAARVAAMAADGLRVLGVARAYFEAPELPSDPHQFEFAFLGLVGLADPPRADVRQAIAECQRAGVQVMMITGDHPLTAARIAAEIGLDDGPVLVGGELETLDDAALIERLRETRVFARVLPEQKLRLVSVLKASGAVVAMTGDGVNDAPALKAAHIGIAMGGRGSDVAREAAAVVLLDDAFASIVAGIRMGRRIYDNLRRAMVFIIAVHIPIAGVALIPLLLKWPLVLSPLHIAFLELVIDPACALAFESEAEEPDIMDRPPRPSSEPLLSRAMVTMAILQGLGVVGAVLAVFAVALARGLEPADARTLTFATLVLSYVGLILTNRSLHRGLLTTLRVTNPTAWLVCGGAVALLALVVAVPPVRHAFQFTVLHPIDLAVCVGAASAATASFELGKWLRGKRHPVSL
ncbi:MAG TPA: cation-translocating P-type ATPase [Candidatus Dormibacteraeota bacterium]|nr:cation-translocating P-type ATPase [Candidatus Dormibacteraeota bacterium]